MILRLLCVHTLCTLSRDEIHWFIKAWSQWSMHVASTPPAWYCGLFFLLQFLFYRQVIMLIICDSLAAYYDTIHSLKASILTVSFIMMQYYSTTSLMHFGSSVIPYNFEPIRCENMCSTIAYRCHTSKFKHYSCLHKNNLKVLCWMKLVHRDFHLAAGVSTPLSWATLMKANKLETSLWDVWILYVLNLALHQWQIVSL